VSRSGVCLVRLVLGLFLGSPAGGAEVDIRDMQERAGPQPDRDSAIVYTLVVLQGAGWDSDQVTRAVRQVEAIFDQCGVSVVAAPVYRLSVPEEYQRLSEAMQPRLLSALPRNRPAVLLVNHTRAGDTAYAYLESSPVASRGTAWITRASHPACLGTLLAHELGHILLRSGAHHSAPGNLMSHTCSYSNVAGFRAGTSLARAQCARLRQW